MSAIQQAQRRMGIGRGSTPTNITRCAPGMDNGFQLQGISTTSSSSCEVTVTDKSETELDRENRVTLNALDLNFDGPAGPSGTRENGLPIHSDSRPTKHLHSASSEAARLCFEVFSEPKTSFESLKQCELPHVTQFTYPTYAERKVLEPRTHEADSISWSVQENEPPYSILHEARRQLTSNHEFQDSQSKNRKTLQTWRTENEPLKQVENSTNSDSHRLRSTALEKLLKPLLLIAESKKHVNTDANNSLVENNNIIAQSSNGFPRQSLPEASKKFEASVIEPNSTTFARTEKFYCPSQKVPDHNKPPATCIHPVAGKHPDSPTHGITKKRRLKIGEWKTFVIKNVHRTMDNALEVWIVDSEENLELHELLSKSEQRPIQSISKGEAALTKCNGKFIRVVFVEHGANTAIVQDVDTGDEIEVSLADIFILPAELKLFEPLATRVVIEAESITDSAKLIACLEKAKRLGSSTKGCAVTWDFIPKFVFRLPGCRALGLSKNTAWSLDNISPMQGIQDLYNGLPRVPLPVAGTMLVQCLITHVENSTVYITWEELHNVEVRSRSSDAPLEFKVGEICLQASDSDPSLEKRCYIEKVNDDRVWVRWIDCGKLLLVPKASLHPLPKSHWFAPTTIKAKLIDSDFIGVNKDEVHKLLQSLPNLQILILDSNPVPEVIVFTEDFVEINAGNMAILKAAEQEKNMSAGCESPSTTTKISTIVGVGAFGQIWVVPDEKFPALEQMEANLGNAQLRPLIDLSFGTMCAAEVDGKKYRATLRLQMGKRFLVRLVDRALEVNVVRIYELPQEFHNIPSPSYRVALCDEQTKDAHFGRFMIALRKHPKVLLTPVEEVLETNLEQNLLDNSGCQGSTTDKVFSVFIRTTDGRDIMSAYAIRGN